MFKKILLFFIGITTTAIIAQDTIIGTMKPVKDYSYIILNQLNSVNKKYLTNATIKNGFFKMAVPKGTKPGMLRLVYDVNKNLFIDLLYNKETIEFEFNPDYPVNSVAFKTSEENKLYQNFIDEISVVQNKLDSLQVVYFKTQDVNQENLLSKIYSEELQHLKTTETLFHKKSEGKLAAHFIKANKRFYENNLIKDTEIYLANLKSHYFDYINFDDPVLAKSSLFIDRVMDYVLYLTNSRDRKKLIELREKAVTTALDKIKSNAIKNEIMQSLLYSFAQQENKELTDYIFENHFKKLPIALRDYEFKNMINDLFKTTIGQPAPAITWRVYDKPYSLETLEKSEYYVILFWGSTCPHCLKEVPKFNTYLATQKNIKTIAIGIENKKSKAGWKEETFNLENMTHILGLGVNGNKWKNKYVQDYGVSATPTYFILDSNKNIIAKPYDFKELQEFFSKQQIKN